MTPAHSSAWRAPLKHFVSIKSDGTRLSYIGSAGEPATSVKVRRGDIVQWHFEEGNYSIVFKGPSPFEDSGFAGTGNVPTREGAIVGPDGTYAYAVTVVPDSGQPILDDPEIIVGDGT